jgi:uncharacterized delta-60 repeat protein
MRLLPNGGTDTSFGNNGTAYAQINPSCISFCSETTQSLALQPDGKIVVVANVNGSNGAGLGIARFLGNGQLDNSFDEDGKVFTITAPFGSPAQIIYNFESVALQRDGKIVVAGGATPTGGTSDFAVFRYTPTGALDTTFDGDGKALFPVESDGDRANIVLVQSNGKIVVAGESAVGTNKNFAVVRLNADGSFDTTFDGDGKATTDISGGAPDSISRAVLQPDGKILSVGYAGINETNSTAGLVLARYIGDTPATRRPAFDFDGDGKADVSLFRPSTGNWFILPSQTGGFYGFPFGQAGDQIAPADYDGDGKTDVAVFRNGTWYLQRSNLGFTGISFGESTDKPGPADYDGDGNADVAVFRPSNGTWYLQRSTAGFTGVQFGLGTDLPVPADYDGDRKTDLAVFRNGNWYLNRSSAGFTGVSFGTATDRPVPNAFVP